MTPTLFYKGGRIVPLRREGSLFNGLLRRRMLRCWIEILREMLTECGF
jgi:hypothetical protein